MPTLQKEKSGIPRTLLVGGAGVLGSHLCDRLIGEGHEAICMDNLLTGRMENIQHLFSHPRFTFIQHDITRPIAYPSMIGKTSGQDDFIKFDYVLHLASPDSPNDYPRHRLHTLKIVALGCYHTLALAMEQGKDSNDE
ncbi:MAG TPA: NAD-dependent epimerase/dehydratase family protein [Terriglobia bacterium]|nr:NAD-dependent epimerase/dehydratase family protein [Terriglobia bacterium]